MREAARALQTMVRLSLRADAPRSIAAVVTATGQMATLPLRAIGLRMLTDGIVAATFSRAAAGLAVMVGLTILSRVMAWSSLNVRMRLRENTQIYLDSHIMQLMSGIPGLEHHERPEFLDNVDLVRAERFYLANPFNPISWSLASLFQIGSALILLVGVHPLLALLPLAAVPSAAATMRKEWASGKLREAHAEPNRALAHIFELTTNAATAKELRIYGLTGHLRERRHKLYAELERVRIRTIIGNSVLACAAWLFFAGCFVVAVIFTLGLAESQRISVGSVALMLTLSAQINFQLIILVFNLTWLERTHRAVRRLVWLEDYAAEAHARAHLGTSVPVPDRLRTGIRLTGVSFTYPGTDKPVLETVDLELPAGQTVAIVGENGAGKTTLIKLLCRFYEPTSGRITVDSLDLGSFGIDAWRSRLTAGFQDFAQLHLLARESVGVGQTSQLDDDGWILEALERASASGVMQVLPAGLTTQLGRQFDGVDLSTGQWQKLALARTMMRTDPLLMILDEPTASLDASTEHALFEHYAQAAQTYAARSGTITILVSHRFSTVRMADVIVVIADGRIAELGSHKELIRARGMYAELFGLQAGAYR